MERYLENLKKEKRAFYLVQIRKESNEKIFAIKRNNFLLKENENQTMMNNSSIEENINVYFKFFSFITTLQRFWKKFQIFCCPTKTKTWIKQ